MIKYVLAFFWALLCFSAHGQQNVVIENDSLILWQTHRKLTWEDFKGKPNPVKIHNAAASGISFPYNFNYQKGQLPVLDIKCYFEKYIAWTLTCDNETLEHEQIHFDIAEWHTRNIRQCVEELHEDYVYNIEKYMVVVDSILDKCQKVQDQFDYEVLANYPRQLEWREMVDKELEELNAYEYLPETSN